MPRRRTRMPRTRKPLIVQRRLVPKQDVPTRHIMTLAMVPNATPHSVQTTGSFLPVQLLQVSPRAAPSDPWCCVFRSSRHWFTCAKIRVQLGFRNSTLTHPVCIGSHHSSTHAKTENHDGHYHREHEPVSTAQHVSCVLSFGTYTNAISTRILQGSEAAPLVSGSDVVNVANSIPSLSQVVSSSGVTAVPQIPGNQANSSQSVPPPGDQILASHADNVPRSGQLPDTSTTTVLGSAVHTLQLQPNDLLAPVLQGQAAAPVAAPVAPPVDSGGGGLPPILPPPDQAPFVPITASVVSRNLWPGNHKSQNLPHSAFA